jgi:hypothetical protein
MIEQSIVHLPDLVKDFDRPVSIYLVYLSSPYSPECVEGEFSEARARLDPETTLFNDARGSAG